MYRDRGWGLWRPVGLIATFATLAPTSSAMAQQPDLGFDVLAGFAVPAGHTTKATGEGATFGFGVMHGLGDRMALTTDVRLSWFYDGLTDEESFGTSTDLRFWRITVGPAVLLTPPQSTWLLRARGGIGIAGVRSGPLPPGSQEPHEARDEGLNEDVFAVTAGFELGRTIDEAFEPFVRAEADLYDLKHFLRGLALLESDIPPSGALKAYSLHIGVRLWP